MSIFGTAQGLDDTDALLNIQADGATYFGNRVTVFGVPTSGSVGNYSQRRTVSIDLTGIEVGTVATLYFDLLGFGGFGSRAVIDDVVLSEGQSPPVDIELSPQSVNENAAGASVGAITLIDPDVGDTHTFVVSDARFEIVGGTLKLRPGLSVDHETVPTVNITITATDTAGLSSTAVGTITFQRQPRLTALVEQCGRRRTPAPLSEISPSATWTSATRTRCGFRRTFHRRWHIAEARYRFQPRSRNRTDRQAASQQLTPAGCLLTRSRLR